jgi:uncharacterized metal-binding protein YceD (DUF177 family)
VQPCIVTLEPVTTRIDTPVLRRYLAEPLPEPAGEVEMPADDSIEALPPTFDLWAVATEALSLALPEYPRAEGATLAAPETAPGEDRVRPFAGLADLVGKDGKRD